MQLYSLLWDEWNEAHALRHRVTPAELRSLEEED